MRKVQLIKKFLDQSYAQFTSLPSGHRRYAFKIQKCKITIIKIYAFKWPLLKVNITKLCHMWIFMFLFLCLFNTFSTILSSQGNGSRTLSRASVCSFPPHIPSKFEVLFFIPYWRMGSFAAMELVAAGSKPNPGWCDCHCCCCCHYDLCRPLRFHQH